MSAHQSATVHVRGHQFTVYFLDVEGKLPTIVSLFLSEYPDDVLQIIGDRVIDLVRVEALKAHRDQVAYIARRVAQEEEEDRQLNYAAFVDDREQSRRDVDDRSEP